MTFNEYVKQWFDEFLEDHKERSEELFKVMLFTDEDLDGDESAYEHLSNLEPNEIWDLCFINSHVSFDDLIDVCGFWTMVLPKVVDELGIKYKFTKDMVDDIGYHCEDYDDPVGFFQDLQHGGCMSGITSMFMYFDETKKFYIEHMEQLEYFVEDLEEELGEPIRKKDSTPRYVFVCMLCYEELARKIGQELFPNEL